jgi:hypothetical protein
MLSPSRRKHHAISQLLVTTALVYNSLEANDNGMEGRHSFKIFHISECSVHCLNTWNPVTCC